MDDKKKHTQSNADLRSTEKTASNGLNWNYPITSNILGEEHKPENISRYDLLKDPILPVAKHYEERQ